MQYFFIVVIFSSLVYSQSLCRDLLFFTDGKKEYSYINELCTSVPRNANLFLALYHGKKRIEEEEIVLFTNQQIYKDSNSIFKTYTQKKYFSQWLELFNKSDFSADDKDLKKLSQKVRRDFYLQSLQKGRVENLQNIKTKCISGKLIKGNHIISITPNEFITIEATDPLTLRWYYDNNQCDMLEKFPEIEIKESVLKTFIKLK